MSRVFLHPIGASREQVLADSVYQSNLKAMGEAEKRVREAEVARAERERCYDRFFDLTVDADALSARVPTEREMDCWLPSGDAGGARESVAAEDGAGTARRAVHQEIHHLETGSSTNWISLPR